MKKKVLVPGDEKIKDKKSRKMAIGKCDADRLFDRIASILEQARANVVRAVNSQTVIAYWLIGREIVQELQKGEERAEYGKRFIEDLSERLMERYGKGFPATNLKYFRTFYLTYSDRMPEIRHPESDELRASGKGRPMGDQLGKKQKLYPRGGELKYSYLLRCFVLIDLKTGKLTHQDIGQMDGYVRMYEEHGKAKDDNPTIGLILCSERNAAVAKYSVLNENKQLFASKYLTYLPTEKEMKRELQRERQLIEMNRSTG